MLTVQITAPSATLLDQPPPDGASLGTINHNEIVEITLDEGLGYLMVIAAVAGEQRLGFISAEAVAGGTWTEIPPAIHKGDPDLPSEPLGTIRTPTTGPGPSATSTLPVPPPMQPPSTSGRREPERMFRDQLLTTAANEIGVSRTTKPARVTEYLNLFGYNLKYSNGVYVPFCAAGVGWAICKAYCDLAPANGGGYRRISYTQDTLASTLRSVFSVVNLQYCPLSAGCDPIEASASASHRWLPADVTPSPGWLVFYNWAGNRNPEHVGIVESASANSLITIEFNTKIDAAPGQGNGGAVARKDRQRARTLVVGYVKTY